MTQAMELILVIDDDRDLCELLDEYLTREGFWVETAYDGENGIDKALAETYGVVVLDVMLPGKHDGFDVLKQMRTRTNTPVLMLTAEAMMSIGSSVSRWGRMITFRSRSTRGNWLRVCAPSFAVRKRGRGRCP